MLCWKQTAPSQKQRCRRIAPRKAQQSRRRAGFRRDENWSKSFNPGRGGEHKTRTQCQHFSWLTTARPSILWLRNFLTNTWPYDVTVTTAIPPPTSALIRGKLVSALSTTKRLLVEKSFTVKLLWGGWWNLNRDGPHRMLAQSINS